MIYGSGEEEGRSDLLDDDASLFLYQQLGGKAPRFGVCDPRKFLVLWKETLV